MIAWMDYPYFSPSTDSTDIPPTPERKCRDTGYSVTLKREEYAITINNRAERRKRAAMNRKQGAQRT